MNVTTQPGKIRVLLFEDELSYRQLLEQHLREEEGFEVFSSGDREELIELAGTRRPHIAVVDLYVDNEPWFSAPKELRKASPGLRVIALTRSPFDSDARTAMRLEGGDGFNGYLTKHMRVQDIARSIREAAAGGTPIDPSMTQRLLSRPEIELDPIEILVLEAKQRGLEGAALRDALPKNHGKPLGERQVGRYLASARRKLGAATTEQALVEAISRNLIRVRHKLSAS